MELGVCEVVEIAGLDGCVASWWCDGYIVVEVSMHEKMSLVYIYPDTYLSLGNKTKLKTQEPYPIPKP